MNIPWWMIWDWMKDKWKGKGLQSHTWCDVNYLHTYTRCTGCGKEMLCDHGQVKLHESILVSQVCEDCGNPWLQQKRYHVEVFLIEGKL